MSENFSKPIQKTDDSAKQLIIEALEGQQTGGFDLDSVYYIKETYYVLEFLKCDTVRPYNSHPRRYWFKNRQKFLSLWKITEKLEGRLYLVNYEDSREQFKVIRVISMDESGIIQEKVNLWNFEQFKTWFKALNNLSANKESAIIAAEDVSIASSDEPKSNIQFDISTDKQYISYLPLYTIKAAAGYFGDGESVEIEGWIKAEGIGRLNNRMFVVRIVGNSMEPKIHNGDYCVFQANPNGTRQGKIVLAQHRDYYDEDNAGSYSVKQYESEKSYNEDGTWQHEKITLNPINKNYNPIVIVPDEVDSFRIIGEYVATLNLQENQIKKKSPNIRHYGYCIHCGKEIEYSFGCVNHRYYCKSCWREWYNKGHNPKQIEKYCHRCGNEYKSTFELPICQAICSIELGLK